MQSRMKPTVTVDDENPVTGRQVKSAMSDGDTRGFRLVKMGARATHIAPDGEGTVARSETVRTGGEGGIRTRYGNFESVTYRFVVAVSAGCATAAGAAWPILAHGRD
jgi:hypothetical protein